MGMYSEFEYEDIEIKDLEGLKHFLKEWDKLQKGDNFSKMIKKDDNAKEYLTFEDWDNIQLISYWYDEQLIFLDCIAKFIEGYVSWKFDNDDEDGSVSFEDGQCTVSTGQMKWTEWKPLSQIRKDLDKKFKKLMIICKL